MPALNPDQTRKLRGLIARALDGASTEAEAQGSALAACRLLAAEGLGVGGDPKAAVTIGGTCGKCSGAGCGELPPDYVYQAVREGLGVDVGCGRRRRDPSWNDLYFGGR